MPFKEHSRPQGNYNAGNIVPRRFVSLSDQRRKQRERKRHRDEANKKKRKPEKIWKDVDRVSTIFIAAATVAIAWGAIIQTEILGNTERTISQDLVASNRAWIAPGDIVVPERFLRGESNEIYLTFGNVGKGPAHKVTADIQHFILPSHVIHDREDVRFVVDSWTRCDTLKPSDSGFVLFPSGKLDARQRLLPTDVEKEFLVSREQSDAKKGYFMVVGCFAYEAFDEPRISTFCRFLDYNEGKTPKDWPSTFCDYREYAD